MTRAAVLSLGQRVAIVSIGGALALPGAALAGECAAPMGTRLVRSTGEAIVTGEKHSDGRDLLDGGSESRTWRGCFRQRGAQVELEQGTATFGGGHLARWFRLAGPMVASIAADWTKYETNSHVVVVDLISGVRWMSDVINTVSGDPGFTALEVNRLSDAAWIRRTYDGRGHLQWRLFLRAQDKVVLEYRSHRELTDLLLDTHRLQWREGRKLRVRPL